MKNKLSKIIFIIIFLALVLLMLSNSVKATFIYDGVTYYTSSDIKWNNTEGKLWITVLGDWYYCRNHGYPTTGIVTDTESGFNYETTTYSANYLQYRAKYDALSMLADKAREVGWNVRVYFNESTKDVYYTCDTKRALQLTWHNKTEVTVPEERALYAFLSEFYGNPIPIAQKSLWNYLNEHPEINDENQEENDRCDPDANGNTEVNYAASYYVNTWLPNGKANLRSNASQAKTRINGSDYIVGPFTITYNQATIGKVEFSKVYSYAVKDQNGNAISGAQITNSNGISIGSVPTGQEFYIKFPYNESITNLNIDVKIQSIADVYAEKIDVTTKAYDFSFVIESGTTVQGKCFIHEDNCKYGHGHVEYGATRCMGDERGSTSCNGNISDSYLGWAKGHVERVRVATKRYQNMRKIDGHVIYEYPETHLSTPLAPQEMDIAGYVWEDGEQGKDQAINGKLDNNEKRLEGIEVRLYDVNTGRLADVRFGTNPTLTDANGHYEFKGVNPTHKYYVVFTYDGMLYTNTYGAGIPEYNTGAWNVSSKGSELVSERDILNNKFVTIGSYPASYKTTAIFGGNYLTNGYNKIFEINDSRVTYYKNRVTQELRNYLSTHNRLEDVNYISNIYNPIINSLSGDEQTEAKQVLQYIWDCRVKAYAGNESEQDGKISRTVLKYYPYYDYFALTWLNPATGKVERLTAENATKNWEGYRAIYNGQLYINLGLIKRPTTDLQLDEDLYKTVVSINGQDETYTYGTFSSKGVKVNSADAMLTQNIATDDYDYKVDSTTLSSSLDEKAAYPVNYAPIQIYVTYRINIKNNSSIPTAVNEVAAYIDSKYYSYSDAYTTTKGNTIKGVEGTFIYPDSATTYAEKNLTDYNANSFGLKVNPNSKYGTESETGKFIGTDLYISFDQNVILEQNQMVAIYITYRLGENSTTNSKFNCTYNSTQAGGENHAYAILQDLFRNTDDKKVYVYTRAEINAYSTFFKKDFDVRNTQNKYNAYYTYTSDISRGSTYRAAGIFDALSMPGNLDRTQINEYEQNKTRSEDDWDKASTFVLMDAGGTRKIAGNVWETVDEPANYWTTSASYPKFNNSYGAGDITVELVEIKNGIEYVRAKTETASDGSYTFTNYIPGLYTVRFTYGDNAKYDTTQHSKYTKFTLNDEEYKAAYNGQFYQSAKANPKTNDNQYWYAVEENERYSDAYDEVERRMAVNEYLQTYKYNDVVSLLKHPTDYMAYAYTSLMELEVEKAKTTSSSQNPSYTIQNIDFALTPRTESKLSINKEVTHLKLILQNGAVQFDADTATIREQGVPAVVQAAQGYDINISMSSELVNGATLEITYKITVTNESPEDTVTYYKDSSGNIIALGLYKEDPTKVIYYEDGLIRTYNNNGGFQRNADTTWVSKVTAGTSVMKTFDASKTQRVETTTRPDLIADFVSNNLNFTKSSYTGASINDGWDLYTGTKQDFENEYYKQKQDASELALKPQSVPDMTDESKDIYDSNAIVLANDRNPLVTTNLKHGESVSGEIILSKVISVNDNSTDTKSYTNKVRIIRINNTVSRVQDMAGAKLAHKSEHVIVSDPTGIGNMYLGILLTLIVAAIIAVGIVFIKKFAIK